MPRPSGRSRPVDNCDVVLAPVIIAPLLTKICPQTSTLTFDPGNDLTQMGGGGGKYTLFIK